MNLALLTDQTIDASYRPTKMLWIIARWQKENRLAMFVEFSGLPSVTPSEDEHAILWLIS
jgi:hypothetical protein